MLRCAGLDERDVHRVRIEQEVLGPVDLDHWSGIVVGGVVVAPRASELIFPVAIAVAQRLTVDELASSFTVYPSMSGSVAEAARRLHGIRSLS